MINNVILILLNGVLFYTFEVNYAWLIPGISKKNSFLCVFILNLKVAIFAEKITQLAYAGLKTFP